MLDQETHENELLSEEHDVYFLIFFQVAFDDQSDKCENHNQ